MPIMTVKYLAISKEFSTPLRPRDVTGYFH